MRIFRATDAKNQFGVLLESCADAPVAVERHGRVVAYLLSPKDFKTVSLNPFESLANRLRSLGVVYATVFGSVAMGQAKFGSDIDVAISTGCALRPALRRKLQAEIAEASGRAVDLIDLESSGGLIFTRAMKGVEIVCDRISTRQRLVSKLIRAQDDRRVAMLASAVVRPRLFA
jgi:predicted nucleotidyltransferase